MCSAIQALLVRVEIGDRSSMVNQCASLPVTSILCPVECDMIDHLVLEFEVGGRRSNPTVMLLRNIYIAT
jgi:hypothetical protein